MVELIDVYFFTKHIVQENFIVIGNKFYVKHRLDILINLSNVTSYSKIKNPLKILKYEHIYLFDFEYQKIIKPKFIIKHDNPSRHFYFVGDKIHKKIKKYHMHTYPEFYI